MLLYLVLNKSKTESLFFILLHENKSILIQSWCLNIWTSIPDYWANNYTFRQSCFHDSEVMSIDLKLLILDSVGSSSTQKTHVREVKFFCLLTTSTEGCPPSWLDWLKISGIILKGCRQTLQTQSFVFCYLTDWLTFLFMVLLRIFHCHQGQLWWWKLRAREETHQPINMCKQT